MPFAGYKDFAACVRANQDKDDPNAYCGAIKHEVEDKLDGPAEVPDRKLTLAVAGATTASVEALLALHDTPGSPHKEHGRRGGAPKLPEPTRAMSGREARNGARRLLHTLPREVREQFAEEFQDALDSGHVPEMQAVVERWEADPWSAGKRGKLSEQAAPVTLSVLTPPMTLERAVTRATLDSTDALLTLHNTPGSPHREHMNGRGQGAGVTMTDPKVTDAVNWALDNAMRNGFVEVAVDAPKWVAEDMAENSADIEAMIDQRPELRDELERYIQIWQQRQAGADSGNGGMERG